MQPSSPDDRLYLDPRRLRAILLPALLAAGVFFIACLGFIATGRVPTRAAYDQMYYHEPTIQIFAPQLPRPDFYDYYSATTPGYHVALAVVARIIPDSTQALQVASAIIGSLLIGLLAAACAGVFLRTPASDAPPRSRLVSTLLPAALALPLGCSMYVFQSGAWLLPDNAGWFLALCVCLLVLRAVSPHARAREGLILLAGLTVALVVFTRQSHAWTAGIVWLGGWLAATLVRPHKPAESAAPDPFRLALMRDALFTSIPKRVAWASAAAMATIPAVLTLLYFVNLWHGLTPFRFQFQHQGKSPAALAMMLALVGLFSIFLAPIVLPLLARLWLSNPRSHAHDESSSRGASNGRWAILLAIAIALLASLIPNTTYSIDDGRWTGLWNLVRATPSIANHTSPLLLALALVGSVSLVAWLSAWPTWPQRLVIVAMLLGCTAAVAAGSELWPRYLEPMALIIIALSAAHALANPIAPFKFPIQPFNRLLAHVQRASLAALCLFLLALTAQGTRSMQRLTDPPPPIKSPGDPGIVPLEIQVPPRR